MKRKHSFYGPYYEHNDSYYEGLCFADVVMRRSEGNAPKEEVKTSLPPDPMGEL